MTCLLLQAFRQPATTVVPRPACNERRYHTVLVGQHAGLRGHVRTSEPVHPLQASGSEKAHAAGSTHPSAVACRVAVVGPRWGLGPPSPRARHSLWRTYIGYMPYHTGP